ncbi:hypothetical protein K8O93_17910 [Gordonia bronchialis]|uniref:hypothetical protein n=1 Tax=Gordonia bronchialis TaxID=2054 RepID=UPI001CBC6161|nr:hypothetical protein [Gordonia bronchialis]UAK37041.1 hypothetical protein K8O93_17910 [Gordonia bronchialis]
MLKDDTDEEVSRNPGRDHVGRGRIGHRDSGGRRRRARSKGVGGQGDLAAAGALRLHAEHEFWMVGGIHISADRVCGAGKRQSVIYRLLLADANTGKLLQSSNWSGAQSVTGNRPARWNGVGTLTGAWQGNYHLAFEVRFFQPGGKWQGTITSLQTRYQIFNQRIGPYGPTSSCVKLKNFG